MSQEKVDRYKQEKATRKQTMKKEKLKNVLRRCVIGIVGILLIGWIGYSAYGTYESNKAKEEIEVDYTAFDELSEKLQEAAEADK